MRVALLIGVSKYTNCQVLPSCENDAAALYNIIERSGEFDEVRLYKGKVNSNLIKDEIKNFFISLRGKKVSEIFFYFSGHGSYYDNEFYYVLSDYEENRKRGTSLQNEEIDNLIKSISPELVVKVIDACQAGMPYIKTDTDVVEKYYQDTQKRFKSCYFFYSSKIDQSSYADENLSYFTKSFLSAIRECNKTIIRYKDIIDYISDDFDKKAEQTPFFITQASFTEDFITLTSDIKSSIELHGSDKVITQPRKTEAELSYIDKIKKDSTLYVTEEELIQLLQSICEHVSSIKFDSEFLQLYEVNIEKTYSTYNIPKKMDIASWISRNQNQYFTQLVYRQEQYEEIVPTGMGLRFPSLKQEKKEIKYKTILDGYEHTLSLPYIMLSIEFIPKFPNLKKYVVLMTFIVSSKNIKIYLGLTDYINRNWNEKLINENFNWTYFDFIIKDKTSILENITLFIKDSAISILKEIQKTFMNI